MNVGEIWIEKETEDPENPEAMYWHIDSFVLIPLKFDKKSASYVDNFLTYANDVTTLIIQASDKKQLHDRIEWFEKQVKTFVKAEKVMLQTTGEIEAGQYSAEMCLKMGYRICPCLL